MYQENQDKSCVYQTWTTKIHIQEASTMVKQHRTSSNIIEHHQHHRTHFHHHIIIVIIIIIIITITITITIIITSPNRELKRQNRCEPLGNLSKRPAISHCHLPGATTAAPGGTAVAKRVPGTAGTGSSTCEGEFGAVEIWVDLYTDSLLIHYMIHSYHEKCRFDMT